MDEEFNPITTPYPTEIIPENNYVIRQVPIIHTEKQNGKRIPNESHFVPDLDGFSVNWKEKTSIKDIYILIALTQTINKNGELKFKDHTAFKLFQFQVSEIKMINGLDAVNHTPIFNGNPAPVGKPNNPAHATLVFDNDVEIRVKLSDFVRENYENCHLTYNISALRLEIEELQNRLNDTSYHMV